MRKNHKLYLPALIILFAISVQAQQHTIYTNYLFNAYGFNPAIAGSQKFMQANVYYRNQWTGFDGAPKTYFASIYGPLKKFKHMAVGGMVMSDKTGLLSRNSGHLSYGYHLNLNSKTKIGFGISAGMIQYNIKLYDVKAYDQGDEMLTGNILATSVFDANAGLYLYNPKYFIGFSGLQILGNKINWPNSQGRLYRQYNTMGGFNIKVDKNFVIQPSFIIKKMEPGVPKKLTVPTQIDYGMKFIFKDMVSLGGAFRTEGFFKAYDAIALMAEFKAMKKIVIGYSFDVTLSPIKKYQTGSHEIFLAYLFIKKKAVDAEEEEFKVIDNSVHHNIKNKKDEKKKEKKHDEKKPDEPK